MITKEDLEKRRQKQQKEYFGSEAKAMFVDGIFSSDNWNGGDGLIRQYFYEKVWMETKVFDIDITYDSIHFWGDIIITHTWYDDQNYVTITFSGMIEENEQIQLDAYEHVVFLKWYKSRGRTESVNFDGNPMTEQQYLFVLNALQETGFKFNLE